MSDDPFKDIRPYHDEEIRPVLDRLLLDRDFIRSMASFSAPRLFRWLPGPISWLTRNKLRSQLKHVDSVASMQDVIAGYMDEMIERTTSRLTHSGLENLSPDYAYLFVSNHRDIAMDPAFVNYMLYHAGFGTLHIAIGDNLLKRPFVTDMMRLNKSFIVRRNLKGRELLKSSKQLSDYIHHCVGQHNNVWIAQREGRAKDGVDRTDTALLKMLGMALRPAPLAQALTPLRIVPVSISYEFDPCDELKGIELYQRAERGIYEKDDQSDINSIVTGLVGFKGHVHVAFGKQLALSDEDDEAIAGLLDEQIISNYRLQQTNFLALQQLRATTGQDVPPLDDEGERVLAELKPAEETVVRFNERLAAIAPEVRPYVLRMYANPVLSRYAKEDITPPASSADADLRDKGNGDDDSNGGEAIPA